MRRRQSRAFRLPCTLNSRRILHWARGCVWARVKHLRVFDARDYI
jgi:hypothetical protein